MKKIILTTIFALFFWMELSAQKTDGFFASDYKEYREDTEWGNLPNLPGSHGFDYDYAATPLGSGLFILAGMALLYVRRKKIEN